MSENISPFKKIKIALLLPSLNVGGAEKLIFSEMAQMKEDKKFAFEIHLIFEEGALFDDFSKLSIPIHVWHAPHKSLKMLWTLVRLTRYLRRNQIDIVHCHLSKLGALFGRLAGCRVVTTLHKDVQLSVWEKVSMLFNHFMIGCSQVTCRRIMDSVPANRCILLNNAAWLPENQPASKNSIKKQLNLPDHTCLVVSLGRLVRQKGYDVLIDAFKEVVRDCPEVALIIAGQGPDHDALVNQVKKAGLEDKIFFPGMINDINSLLSQCPIYVNASRWEGLPISLIEAMAHHMGILATHVGGNIEVITHMQTGICVPPENSEALANALVQLIQDERLRQQLAKNAYELFIKSYSIHEHCGKLAKLYSAIAHTHCIQ